MKAGANVPSYSGGLAAAESFRIRIMREVARRPSVETGAGVPGQREVNFPVEH